MFRPCLYCKSLTHTDEFCSVYLRAQSLARVKSLLTKPKFCGVSPSPFVGRFGYPHVFVGALATPLQEHKELLDSPKNWVASSMSIGEISSMRAGLVNARAIVDARKVEQVLPVIQEISLSKNPVSVDVELKKIPVFSLQVDAHHAPIGPSVELQKVFLSSNPHIPTKVEKVVNDTELLASEGMQELYNKGIDEYFLSKILSVGSLGIGVHRRLVPTRWSITATDDTLGKHILEKVRDLPLINNYEVLCAEYLGNFYVLFALPYAWQYELFEISSNNPEQFSTDYEKTQGRTTYAEQCAGGYYSVRFVISEWLLRCKRQASVLALRFITPEYDLPLGVWVTREAMRKVVSSKPIVFSSQRLALLFIIRLCQAKFGVDVSKFFKESKLLASQHQKNLGEFV